MHYLERQAARALSPSSGVQPRLPGRFERRAEEPPFAVTVERDAPPDAAPPSAPLREVPRTTIVESVLRREAERVERVHERVVMPAPPPAARELEPRRVERAVPAPPRGDAVPARAVEPLFVPSPPPRRVDAEERQIVERTLRDERIVRMVERRERDVASPRDDVRPVQPRIAPAVVPAAERVAAAQAAIQTTERAAPPPRVRADDAPPAIHVTIGRVDVRAVMTAEAPLPRPQVPAQPSLSLEDYLKQREGRPR
jgi:hypothetical protein